MAVFKFRDRRKNSSGTYDVYHPETEAGLVLFDDGDTFQQKFDAGELTGPQGPQGEKGDPGPQGPQGPAGSGGDYLPLSGGTVTGTTKFQEGATMRKSFEVVSAASPPSSYLKISSSEPNPYDSTNIGYTIFEQTVDFDTDVNFRDNVKILNRGNLTVTGQLIVEGSVDSAKYGRLYPTGPEVSMGGSLTNERFNTLYCKKVDASEKVEAPKIRATDKFEIKDAAGNVSRFRGARSATVIIGTSTAGHTLNDCDFLCDGVDDQVEILAAIESLPVVYDKSAEEIHFGTVVFLYGQYILSDSVHVDFPLQDVIIDGNGSRIEIDSRYISTGEQPLFHFDTERIWELTIRNFYFSVAWVEDTEQCAIFIYGGNNIVIENNFFDTNEDYCNDCIRIGYLGVDHLRVINNHCNSGFYRFIRSISHLGDVLICNNYVIARAVLRGDFNANSDYYRNIIISSNILYGCEGGYAISIFYTLTSSPIATYPVQNIGVIGNVMIDVDGVLNISSKLSQHTVGEIANIVHLYE